jgi:hypothetical protein
MMTFRERHLISILQGRVGPDAPAEFQNEPPLEYNFYDVKALVAKLSNRPRELRSLMSEQSNMYARAFNENVNQALVDCAAKTREAKAKLAKK